MDPHSSWPGLPKELLLNITNRLDSRVDRLYVRAVCRSWRSEIPPPPRTSSPPLKLPFPMGPNPDLNPSLRGHFDFVESTIYCFQPLKKISASWDTPKSWIIKVEEPDDLGTARFEDPLHRFDYDYFNLCLRLPHRLNVLDYRVSEVAKFYELRFGSARTLTLRQMYAEIQPPDFKSLTPERVAVYRKGSYFAVMTIHTAGHLSIWERGAKKWRRVKDNRAGACYSDVVYHKGNFYAVDYFGFTISVDLLSGITNGVTPEMRPCGYNIDGVREKRLVSSEGDLFLLDKDRYPMDVFLGRCDPQDDIDARPTCFHVYKLVEEKCQWVKVKTLGNRAVIVCDMCTFSVSAIDFGGIFKKNCIYYSEDCFCVRHDHEEKEPGHDAALFDVEDCSAWMLSGVLGHSGRLFWPPPSWLVSRNARG